MEPHLHSHVLLPNAVERDRDGQLRGVYAYEVYKNQALLGTIYRQLLASRLEELGYKVVWKEDTKGHPVFEIAGFTEEQLKGCLW